MASSRPYIGGSQNNSFLELTFGYNGLGRINGDETGSVGGGGGAGGSGRWGATGWDRMFDSEIGGQISWLLPAALILLVAGLWATRKRGRTSVTRASFLVWGCSLLMTAAVFSYMAGIFHQYYTVALAPYLAAVVGMGAGLLWEKRRELWASVTLAASVVAAAAWGYALLNRTSGYLPWLKWLVLTGGLAAALGLVFARPDLPPVGPRGGGGGPGGRARRSDRVHAQHGGLRAHRLHSDGGSGGREHDGLRRRPGSRRRHRRHARRLRRRGHARSAGPGRAGAAERRRLPRRRHRRLPRRRHAGPEPAERQRERAGTGTNRRRLPRPDGRRRRYGR